MNRTYKKNNFTLSIFIFFYVISKIYDNAHSFNIISRISQFNINYVTDYLIVITGVISLIKPGSIFRASLFLLVVSINFIIELPKASNHEFFALFVNITFLACFAYLLIKGRGRVSDFEFGNLIIPILRIETYLLYFWATVNKLNYDYFNPDVSCATAQIFNVNRRFRVLPENDFFISLNPYLSAMIEGGIPLLLLFRKTRILGILLAIIFHFIIGFAHFRFSILVYALIILFIPEYGYEFIYKRMKKVKDNFNSLISHKSKFRQLNKSIALRVVFQIIFIILIIQISKFIFTGDNKNIIQFVSLFIITLCLFLMASYVLILKYRNSTPGFLTDYKLKNKLFLVFPLMIFIYGLFPHVGLKNIQVMAMYSNLRTEGGKSNHFFIPTSLQIFDNLKVLAEIESSSLKGLDKFSSLLGTSPISGTYVLLPDNYIKYYGNKDIDLVKRFKYRIPLFEIRNIISTYAAKGMTDIEISYRINDSVFRIDNAEDDNFLSGASAFHRKFLPLGAVPDTDRGVCKW